MRHPRPASNNEVGTRRQSISAPPVNQLRILISTYSKVLGAHAEVREIGYFTVWPSISI